MNSNCPFCKSLTEYKNEILLENEFAFMREDKYPVTQGHTLIIPKRHFPNFFDISPDEMDDIEDLLFLRKDELEAADKTIEGFNIGINIGEVAGQTVEHFHIHLIPRRKGDMDDPRGGVRGVIPERQKY